MFSFNPNNRFFAFVNRLVDVLFLNLLWLAFSLPVVTMGAATAAAYSVTLKMVNDEEGYLFRGFIKAFRENFGVATKLWLLNLVVLYALWLDYQIIAKSPEPPLAAFFGGILLAAGGFCAFVFAYPLTARYENTAVNAIRNSFRISVRYFGKALLLLVLLGLEAALFLWNVPMLVAGSLIGPMIVVYTVSGIAKPIFLKIEEEANAREEAAVNAGDR